MTRKELLHLISGIAIGLVLAAPAMAQRSPIAVPKPIPGDLTPRVIPQACGHFRGHFGPIDFRTADPRDRRVVEEWHFDMELQTFLGGQVYGRNMAGVGGVAFGFLYTLRSFPNHPVALLVLDQLGRRLKSETPQSIEYPIECWFLRAFMIAPDDPAVRALYGGYLAHRGRRDEALANLAIGDQGTRERASLQHQVGLAYVELKEWRAAQLCALRLARLGYPLDTVARRVREAGKWDDALALPPDPAASGPDGAASASGPVAAASAPGT